MFAAHPWSSWLLILATILLKLNLSAAETRVVCYYTNWSVYRPGTAKFNPQNINPYLCTHLIYAFGGFTKENNFKPFDKYQDIEKGGYAKFTGLKTYNKNLKTMLAIGGWNEGSSRFSPMVANAERRKEFVKNSIKFLRQNHFDGLDLDWEYPSFRDGGKPRDRDNYALLVQELREEYDREAEKTGRPRLLLTMAVPAGIEYINKGYDVPKLTKYLDWMNILSYDYHSAFEPAVNHHSPLYPLEEESEYNYDAELNINHTIYHYLKAGAQRNKLVLGIPTYGRSYTLFNPDATEIGDPADGPGEMGDATRENGYLAYYEICENLKSDDWTVEQPNQNAMGPYAYKENQWVGYDDEDIVRKKAEYVAQNQLGGIMFWSIDNDDFRGNCHGKPYPLIEAAKESLMAASGSNIDNAIVREKPTKPRKRPRPSTKRTIDEVEEEEDDVGKPAQNSGGRQNSVSTRKRTRPQAQKEETSANKRRIRIKTQENEEEPTRPNETNRKTSKRRNSSVSSTTSKTSIVTPSYTTPEPPTTPDAGSDFKCEDEGFFAHPRDCKKYFWCLSSGPSELGIVAHQFTCPSGLYFNKAADSCDYTQNVLCNKKKATTTTTTTTSPSTTKTTTLSSTFTTTRRPPPKITAATSRTTITSTTTEQFEEEYEYDDEDEIDSEEDPRVIKELIDLIRKAGGIEELEKQLKLQEGAVSVTAPGSTTPPVISKTLYEKVLNRAAAKNPEPSTKLKNSRGPQFDGAKELDGGVLGKRTRPQYTAISRQRPSTENTEQTDEDTEKPKSSRKVTQPEYKSISRNRPSSTTGSTLDDATTLKQEDAKDTASRSATPQTPEYVTLRRKRPTTEDPTSKYVEVRSRSTHAPTIKLDEENEDETNDTHLTNTETQQGNEGVTAPAILEHNTLTNNEEIPSPATTEPTTKVSENISRNLTRGKPYQKANESTTKRGPNKFNFNTTRRRIQQTRADEENETDNPGIIDNRGSSTEKFPQRISNEQRRRGSAKFDVQVITEYDDGSYHQNTFQDRKYRPDIAQEISDLSSLTSVDISDLGHAHLGQKPRIVHRQQQVSTSKVVDSSTTTSRSAEFAGRRPISKPTVVPRKVPLLVRPQPFRRPSSSTTTLEPTPEPSRSTTTTRFNRKIIKRVKPTSTTELLQEDPTTVHSIETTTLALISDINDINYNSTYSDDDIYTTNEEEEENINLSETNIREKSEIRINDLIDGNDKSRRKFEGKISQTKVTYLDEEIVDETTEQAPLLRTRKVIRKLPILPSSTTPSILETEKGRTRKIIRRLKPSTETPSVVVIDFQRRKTSSQNQNDEDQEKFTEVPSGYKERHDNRQGNLSSRRFPNRRINFLKLNQNKEETPENHDATKVNTKEEEKTVNILRGRWKLNAQTITRNSTEINKEEEIKQEEEITENLFTTTNINNKETQLLSENASEEQEEIAITEETTIREIVSVTEEMLTTTISTTDEESFEETTTGLPVTTVAIEKSTFKSTTPFYSRHKLSRPPFLHQRIRPATEGTRLVTSTTTPTRRNNFSRYNARNKFKTRFDRNKSTTESIFNEEIEKPNKTQSIIEENSDKHSNVYNTTTNSLINDTDITKDSLNSSEVTTIFVSEELSTTYGRMFEETTTDFIVNEEVTTGFLYTTDGMVERETNSANDSESTTSSFLNEETTTEYLFNDNATAEAVYSTVTETEELVNKAILTTTIKPETTTYNEIDLTTIEEQPVQNHTEDNLATERYSPNSTKREFNRNSTANKRLRTKFTATKLEEERTTTNSIRNRTKNINSVEEEAKDSSIIQQNTTETIDDGVRDSKVSSNSRRGFVPSSNRFSSKKNTARADKITFRPLLQQRPKYQPSSSTTESISSTTKSSFGRNRLYSRAPPTKKRVTTLPPAEEEDQVENQEDEESLKLRGEADPDYPTTTDEAEIALRFGNQFVTETLPGTTNTFSSDVTTMNYPSETTEQLFTLHHIFSEPENATEATKTNDASTVNSLDNKVEKLIEVNKIVEVSLKENKRKDNEMIENEVTLSPTLVRVGAINRVTVIKVVNSDNNNDTNSSSSSPPSNNGDIVLSTLNFTIPLIANTSEDGSFNYTFETYASNEEREENLSRLQIDGKSAVNTFTPKKAFVTETSTISLEGLFQPHLIEENNEELLQTEFANYVSVKILKQDESHRTLKQSNEQPTLLPIRLLKQDDYSSSKAKVIEVKPRLNSDVIKIAPIAISLANMKRVTETEAKEQITTN